MSKFCDQCGTKLPDNAKFCRACGAKYIENNENEEAKVEKISIVETTNEDKTKAEKKQVIKTKGISDSLKNVNPTVAIIGVMILITLVIVVLILTLGTKSKKDNEESVSESTINPPAWTYDISSQINISKPADEKVEPTPEVMTPETVIPSSEDNGGENTPKVEPTPDDKEQTIMDSYDALAEFICDPYLGLMIFPDNADFLNINHYDKFGMALLVNVDEAYAQNYINKEAPRTGFDKNIAETTENGAYQYYADNKEGQTCEIIYGNNQMMILVGETASFDRP